MSLETEIEGKSIILVGNSEKILKKQNGKRIDSHDIVVRFNLAANTFHNYDEKFVGRKFDFWVYAMKNYVRCKRTYNEIKIQPKKIIRYGNSEGFPESKLKENSLFLGLDIKREVKEFLDIQKHPSTGIVFLYYLLHHCNPSSITLTGFDSFDSKNFYTDKKLKCDKWHDINNEKNYLKSLINNNSISMI